MSEVANKIDRFLNSILLLSENQHEILVGSCTSGVSLTNTQEHILMLVADEALTNSVLAKKLNVINLFCYSVLQSGSENSVRESL